MARWSTGGSRRKPASHWGTLEDEELETLCELCGHSSLLDTRVALLTVRVRLSRGELEGVREALDRAHEVCEREELAMESMTLWRLEAMLAEMLGEDPGMALEEFEVLRASAPEALPDRAWWPEDPRREG